MPPNIRLARFDADNARISTYPTVTIPVPGVFEPKYSPVNEIIFEDRWINLPQNAEQIEENLNGLPEGFVRDPRRGFGVIEVLKSIIDTISEIKGVRSLVMRDGATELNDSSFHLNYDDYHGFDSR